MKQNIQDHMLIFYALLTKMIMTSVLHHGLVYVSFILVDFNCLVTY